MKHAFSIADVWVGIPCHFFFKEKLKIMKNEYEIIYGENAEILSAKVTRRLNANWKLHGHPYVKDGYHCQAMIKNEELKEETKKQLNG